MHKTCPTISGDRMSLLCDLTKIMRHLQRVLLLHQRRLIRAYREALLVLVSILQPVVPVIQHHLLVNQRVQVLHIHHLPVGLHIRRHHPCRMSPPLLLDLALLHFPRLHRVHPYFPRPIVPIILQMEASAERIAVSEEIPETRASVETSEIQVSAVLALEEPSAER